MSNFISICARRGSSSRFSRSSSAARFSCIRSITWIWSAALILRKVPRGELITNGPYSIVKHPLYTSVALLVLPWLGFLFNTWLGALIGIILYIGSRIFAPAEEAALSKTFGASWDEYCNTVKIPWL